MAKKLSEYDILRWVVMGAIILYIVGVVPSYNEGVAALFKQPVVKIVLLALIVLVSLMDHTVAILLVVAYLSSVMMSHKKSPSSQGSYELPMHELPVPTQHKALPKPQAHPKHENMVGGPQAMSVSQEYQLQQADAQQGYQGGDCVALPPPSSGCDPIVGYNAPYDCVCAENCTKDCAKKGRGCLCTGVVTWQNEQNAQGLNYPMGNPGGQVGATF